MYDPETQEIIRSASKHVQAIGRRIQSPKNDLNDFNDLAIALKDAAKLVKIIRKIIIAEQT